MLPLHCADAGLLVNNSHARETGPQFPSFAQPAASHSSVPELRNESSKSQRPLDPGQSQ
jgi:hypothetical protein